MSNSVQRLLITPGEPAGVGPDVTLNLFKFNWPAELVVVADPTLLAERAQQLKIKLNLVECDLSKPPVPSVAGTIKYFPVPLNAEVITGELNPANAQYVLETLKTASMLCEQNFAKGIVTGPVHKGIINRAGYPFSGHTEYFAELTAVPLTVMLFVIKNMKVAMLTTHLPLSQVPKSITAEKINTVICLLHLELQKTFKIEHPRILVCGLNPHAGENGYLGREEIEIITPALTALHLQGYNITGPLPADTIFTPHQLATADVILAMYHDQALPVVKYAGFGSAVNVTLGLPYVRTSVDHGTALDVAGTDRVEAESMQAALKLAIKLTESGIQL